MPRRALWGVFTERARHTFHLTGRPPHPALVRAYALIKRAAAREFRILQSFDHPGILDARDYKDHEFGPALLFAYEPGAMRLDHYLATRGPRLSPGTRLELLR